VPGEVHAARASHGWPVLRTRVGWCVLRTTIGWCVLRTTIGWCVLRTTIGFCVLRTTIGPRVPEERRSGSFARGRSRDGAGQVVDLMGTETYTA
jgi:hypothetical protein